MNISREIGKELRRLWFVYMVRASNGSYYAGISTDVVRRVLEHNEGWRGAKCLRGKRPVELAWWSSGMTKSAALRLEARLKWLTHVEKEIMAVEWEARQLDEVNALLNALDRERAPQTLEEIGDYPDPLEDRYDFV